MDLENQDILIQLATDVDRYYPRLWSLYIDPLYAYVVRQIMSQEDAQDIIQDVFERVYRALKSYPAERILKLQLRPWLYTITKNACCNYKARYQAIRPLPLDIAEGTLYLDMPDTRNELPDTIAETHETRNELLSLVSRLPKKYRDPLFWHFFNDLSYDEIAARLQQKGATIRVHVHRGVSHLRQMLTKLHNEHYNSL